VLLISSEPISDDEYCARESGLMEKGGVQGSLIAWVLVSPALGVNLEQIMCHFSK